MNGALGNVLHCVDPTTISVTDEFGHSSSVVRDVHSMKSFNYHKTRWQNFRLQIFKIF